MDTRIIPNQVFVELNENEKIDVNGGNPVLIAIGVGVAGYFAYEFANEGVKRSTGKTIPENASYYVGKALSSLGSGLKSVGDFLTK